MFTYPFIRSFENVLNVIERLLRDRDLVDVHMNVICLSHHHNVMAMSYIEGIVRSSFITARNFPFQLS